VTEGQTILLPSGKLSSRDKEILEGIDKAYRFYPVRAGEKLGDIITKRKITTVEMEELNPGVDLNKLKGTASPQCAQWSHICSSAVTPMLTLLLRVHAENQLLKLPSNKFTVREREMLMGSGILPREFFEATKNPFIVGVGACGFHLRVKSWTLGPASCLAAIEVVFGRLLALGMVFDACKCETIHNNKQCAVRAPLQISDGLCMSC